MKILYRPEIDGLRAIAVVSVILYHADLVIFDHQPFKGGFIGVDIFFVISGYLITSIILKELVINTKFSFLNFYERRARRILPALLFVMILSLPFAWIFLNPTGLIDFSKSILYSLGFTSNLYFHFTGLEYGSPEGIFKPFLHTWSLSVEEQYYVIFPVILVIIFKYFRKYFFNTLFLFFITSLLLADWGSKYYPSSTFYFIHSRVWELICGSFLAYLELKLGNRTKNKFLNQLFPLLGLCLIGYSILFFDEETYHPSFFTLIPIIGVMLILWFSNKKDIVTKILSYKLIVMVGLFSYSLYLWHYPILSFGHTIGVFYDNISKLLMIILTFILSIFTYFYVEQPARKIKSFKLVFYFLSLSFIFIIILNFTVLINDGFLNRIKVKNYQSKHTFMYLTQNEKPCFGRSKDLCKFGTNKKKVILLGDSQFGSLAYDLHERVKSDYVFLPIVNPGYFHLRESLLVNKPSNKVNESYKEMRDGFDKILKQSKDNIIILGGATSLYFFNKRVKGRALHFDKQFVDSKSMKYDEDSIKNDFINLIQDLSINNKIILVYPIPEIGTNLQTRKFENMVRVYNYYYSDFLMQNKEVINFFDGINFSNVYKVYPYKIFCNKDTDLCKTHNSKDFFFFDGYHPSLEGAKMINSLIINEIKMIENLNN